MDFVYRTTPQLNPFWEPTDILLHPDDPLLPWLRCVKKALDTYTQTPDFSSNFLNLLEDCTRTFQDESRYRNDIRFLKIWVLYADAREDFENVFATMEEKGIGLTHAIFYQAYAVCLELKGNLVKADAVYRLGIFRNAEPLEQLQRFHTNFLSRITQIANVAPVKKDECNHYVSPWSTSTLISLLKKMNPHILKYNGYFTSTKMFPGRVPLSLQNSSRNKIVELGRNKYHIKGCSGQGGFAKVFKAYVNGNPDDVVALKIQRPAFPWEFYMYRQLDMRIPDVERSRFGFARKVHVYSDSSILVCDYLAHGTLQDAINSYVVVGHNMEEVLCIYYTIEMLSMLETLHSVSIIHGDFKPDNLLVRYARDDLEEDAFVSRSGAWRKQGLCLVDWGRGIDLRLFPEGTQFQGDCKTSGFRCIEMLEKRPWTFQVDSYGLCGIVHMMLHGTYMSVEKKAVGDGSHLYQPKSSLKRYWKIDLWKTFFMKLLNMPCSNDIMVLRSLRKSFEDYLCENPHLIKKLKELLLKQKSSLCFS